MISSQLPNPTQNQTSTQTQSDPFKNISGTISAEALPVIMPVRLAIVGPPGKGKSWLAATAPKPIMHYDFDNRAASLRGKPGIMVKTLVDRDPNNPTSIAALENDLALFKSNKASGLPVPATFVLDSATYLKKIMENSLMKQEPSLGWGIKITPNKVFKSASARDTANVIRNFFEYFINEFGALGNVIITFHTKDKIDKDQTTTKEIKYEGVYTTEPQYLETVLSIFNERWRIERDYQFQYWVYTRNDRFFDAVTSLKIDDKEPADIEKILAKHASKV